MSERSHQPNLSRARGALRCSGMGPATAALLAWVSACYQPHESADFPSRLPEQEPQHDWSADKQPSDLPGGGSGQMLRFRVQTAPLRGRFAPNNVGAIWIEDEAGGFVRTLELWGRSRAQYLRRFQASAKGNVVDAVTGATLTMHVEHEVEWNFRAASGEVISDGAYRLKLELTDKNSAGALLEVPFTKDGQPAAVEPPDTEHFQGVRLSVE